MVHTRRQVSEGQRKEEESEWSAEHAVPPDAPIRQLIDTLIDLTIVIKSPARFPEGVLPITYWHVVNRQLKELLAVSLEWQPYWPSCKPWLRMVLERLHATTESCLRTYQLADAESTENWPPYPLHPDRQALFGTFFRALTALPSLEDWRPVEAQNCQGSQESRDQLTLCTLKKVIEEEGNTSDMIRWGTVESLKESCETILRHRKEEGEFAWFMPSRIRELRLLSDRLGSDLPAIPFEAENERTAFSRGLQNPEIPRWSVETDNAVRAWLKSIIQWCESWHVGSNGEAETVAIPPSNHAPKDVRRKWTVKTANDLALELAKNNPAFLKGTCRDWQRAIGCSASLVIKLPLWRRLQEHDLTKRRHKSVRTTALNPTALESLAVTNSPKSDYGDGDQELQELVREQAEEVRQDEQMAKSRKRSRERS